MIRFCRLILPLLLCTCILSGCVVTPATTTTPVTTEPDSSTAPTETIPPTTVVTTPPTQTPNITGWFGLDGKTYYYTDEGEMVTGWLIFGHDRYYFGEDGVMVTGKREVDGEVCYFGPDGVQIALVNPWNFVPDWYEHETVAINSWQYIDARCYDALMEMLQACRDAGYEPYIASAFRTHGDQVYLYNRKIQRLINAGYSEEDAKRLAGTVVAVPGTSEHELGLALDLTDNNYRELDEAQENTPTQKWLMENSWRYGFILRYPSSKSEATGIIYEPWHYRYVGKATAKAVFESGLSLEEYFESER